MELIRICRESRAFMYPLMLPSSGFRPVKVGKSGLLPSEINLIAFGLHEYMTENDELMDLTKGEFIGGLHSVPATLLNCRLK